MTTKHDIQEKVWIMHQNKPKRIKVESIDINPYGSIIYAFYENKELVAYRSEKNTFKTKEELINSL